MKRIIIVLWVAIISSYADAANLANADSVLPISKLGSINFTNYPGKANTYRAILGYSQQEREIEAWYFAGETSNRAMIIGGVHGSELSAIEVARELIRQLQSGPRPYYSVIIIPCLFPDNAATAINNPALIGTVNNKGRYSATHTADPNRQMPALGRGFDYQRSTDYLGRLIEKENQLLLKAIDAFRPQRIVNLHAIRNIDFAGIYADPRTDSDGYALGYETDSSLAVDMAVYIQLQKGVVPGNKLLTQPSSLYYKDPIAALRGSIQKRNLTGANLPGGKGHGVSLGGWASTAIADPICPDRNRPAIRLITVEFPGYKRPADYRDQTQRQMMQQQVSIYSNAIREIFLGNYYVEQPALSTFARN
ncbi:MAG: hypothetical protein H7Y31_08835 [Chitinophagaceae bacterium]|nr:hypothetical protein [Chitinophagaceae bacterium]